MFSGLRSQWMTLAWFMISMQSMICVAKLRTSDVDRPRKLFCWRSQASKNVLAWASTRTREGGARGARAGAGGVGAGVGRWGWGLARFSVRPPSRASYLEELVQVDAHDLKDKAQMLAEHHRLHHADDVVLVVRIVLAVELRGGEGEGEREGGGEGERVWGGVGLAGASVGPDQRHVRQGVGDTRRQPAAYQLEDLDLGHGLVQVRGLVLDYLDGHDLRTTRTRGVSTTGRCVRVPARGAHSRTCPEVRCWHLTTWPKVPWPSISRMRYLPRRPTTQRVNAGMCMGLGMGRHVLVARLSADDVVDNEDVVAVRVVVVVVGHAHARLGQDPARVAVRVVRKVGVGVLVKVDQVDRRLLAWLKGRANNAMRAGTG